MLMLLPPRLDFTSQPARFVLVQIRLKKVTATAVTAEIGSKNPPKNIKVQKIVHEGLLDGNVNKYLNM